MSLRPTISPICPVSSINLQNLARETISSGLIDLPWYEQYLQALRNIRLQAFSVYLDSMAEGSAVINFPSFGKIYTGRVYEGMAAGRPVITVQLEDRPLLESLFEDGKDILLYPEGQLLRVWRNRSSTSFASPSSDSESQ